MPNTKLKFYLRPKFLKTLKMKNLFKVTLAAVAMTFAFSQTQAQESFPSVGLELAMPMGDFGDFSGFGIGGTVGYELGLTDQFGLGLNVGYINFTGKDFDIPGGGTIEGESTGYIPAQVYARYYFTEAREGLFASVHAGLHMHSYDGIDDEGKETTEFDANFSAAPEVGFFLTENISLALRYQMMFVKVETVDMDMSDPFNPTITTTEENETFGYLGLRAAWNF